MPWLTRLGARLRRTTMEPVNAILDALCAPGERSSIEPADERLGPLLNCPGPGFCWRADWVLELRSEVGIACTKSGGNRH